jgi:hypothetical protein
MEMTCSGFHRQPSVLNRQQFPAANVVPLTITGHYKAPQYEIRKTAEGPFISAVDDGGMPEWYQPDEYLYEPLEKQPKKREVWNTAPHLHLQSINLKKRKEILGFVNKHGLLQLWEVDEYKDYPGPLFPGPLFELDVPTYKEGLCDAKSFSSWYINPYYEKIFDQKLPALIWRCWVADDGDLDFDGSATYDAEADWETENPPVAINLQKNPSHYHRYRYREPLGAFISAAEKFQKFMKLLKGDNDKPRSQDQIFDDNSKAQDQINKYIMQCQPVASYIARPEEKWSSHWQVPSLLHACYLLTWIDLCNLKQYKKCGHKPCGRIFIPNRNNWDYCSDSCQNSAKNYRLYHKG